jgi:signal transduction histidine kinase
VFIFRSVTYWLTLLFLVLIGIASIVSWLYVVPPLKDRLVQQKLDSLQVASTTSFNSPIAVTPAFFTNQPYFVDYYQIPKVPVTSTDAQLNARVVVLKADSLESVIDSRPDFPLDLKAYEPLLSRAITEDRVVVGTALVGDSTFAVAGVPIMGDFEGIPVKVEAVVLVSSSLADVASAVTLVKQQILLATALAVGVTLVIGFLASFLIARRLKRIEHGAEAIAGGDLNITVPVRTRDEIGQLAATFNVMGGRLSEAFSAIEYEKKSAETMLNTLSEGVIGVSTDGTVLLHNPAAARFLGDRLHTGAAAAEAFPEELAGIWSDLRDGMVDEPVVFDHRGRTLEALAYPVGTGTDIDAIAVLRDVTQQARVERARRDFVANASHEFKTPLFSLSGFLELLDEEGVEPAERDEYLTMMKEQVERLQSLSLSLLDLSQVDSGAVRIRFQPVDLGALAHSVTAEFNPRAVEHSLNIALDVPDKDLVVVADEERLAQVLRALLDNALKFSADGGSIAVTVGRSGKEATISVSDTGEGIPKSELPRVFDRFYRGAMMRGTKTGTGLGLSIARDLTALMGGTITAASHIGRGSRFTIRLPLDVPPDGNGHSAPSLPPAAERAPAAASAPPAPGSSSD